jgi:hypothetical protein
MHEFAAIDKYLDDMVLATLTCIKVSSRAGGVWSEKESGCKRRLSFVLAH